MFCVLLVGGPGISVAVKRSANTIADGVVKKPAVESVKRDSLEVCLVAVFADLSTSLLR